MRILMLVDAFDASMLRESVRWLRDVALQLATRGHDVQVIARSSADSRSPEEDDLCGVSVLRPPPNQFEEALGAALERSPDVVHLASMGPFGARVVEILRDLPMVLDAHDFGSICPNDDLLHRPRCTPCGEHFPHPNCGNCAGLSRLRAMEERMALVASARSIIVHSAYARARISTGVGRRVERVDFGVDVNNFDPNAPAPSTMEVARLLTTPDVPRVLYLGPPTLGRGAGYVLDLMVAIQARVPDAEIVVVGEDPDSPEWHEAFKGEARELGLLDRMQLIPELPARDLPALYQACTVAMAPLIAMETGGLAILEAMASGLPVVASPLGAVQDLIDDGEDGLLVPATEIPQFADALQRLLLDPGARDALGQSARSRVAERHGIERSMNRLQTIYENLSSTRRRAA